MTARTLFIALTALCLTGCELVDQLMADPKAAQRIADSKAIGSGCRHGLRSIEDCYTLNPKASKAAIFDGWKEMDQYMRENKIEGIPAKATAPVEEIIEEKPADESKAKGPTKAKAADAKSH
ncbi:MAG: hypothetical protein U1E84_04825 [Rhodoferax sp.]